MKNILITGASGYFGRSYIAAHLNASLFCLINRTPVPTIAQTRQISARASVEELTAFLSENRIDTILHLATLFRAHHTQDDIGPMLEANIELGTRLLQAAVNASVTKFVFTGTSWEQHSASDPTPVNLYAATKAAFSKVAGFFGASQQLAVLRLDVFDSFGLGDTRGKLLQALVEASPGKHFELSPGQQKHSFIYIDDILEALQTALDMPVPYGLHQYSLHGDQILSLQEVVGTIERVLGKQLSIDWGKKPYRPREVMTPYIQYQRLPGWNPTHSLESGLEEMCLKQL